MLYAMNTTSLDNIYGQVYRISLYRYLWLKNVGIVNFDAQHDKIFIEQILLYHKYQHRGYFGNYWPSVQNHMINVFRKNNPTSPIMEIQLQAVERWHEPNKLINIYKSFGFEICDAEFKNCGYNLPVEDLGDNIITKNNYYRIVSMKKVIDLGQIDAERIGTGGLVDRCYIFFDFFNL